MYRVWPLSEDHFLPLLTLYYLRYRWHCCACHGASSSSSTPPSAPCRFTWPLCWQRPACMRRPCQRSEWWPSWTTSASSRSRWRSWKLCRSTRPNIPASSPSCSSPPVSLNEARVPYKQWGNSVKDANDVKGKGKLEKSAKTNETASSKMWALEQRYYGSNIWYMFPNKRLNIEPLSGGRLLSLNLSTRTQTRSQRGLWVDPCQQKHHLSPVSNFTRKELAGRVSWLPPEQERSVKWFIDVRDT